MTKCKLNLVAVGVLALLGASHVQPWGRAIGGGADGPGSATPGWRVGVFRRSARAWNTSRRQKMSELYGGFK